MRAFQTSVLERRATVQGKLATEPYEAGWASEALFFIEVHGLDGQDGGEDVALTAQVQLSPDGIRWVNDGAAQRRLVGLGSHVMRVAHFGGWLRLTLSGEAPAEVTVHLALKA